MFKILEKSQSFLYEFSKTFSCSFDDLNIKLGNEIKDFNLSWVLVDRFNFERNSLNWLRFSPVLLKYLTKKHFLGEYNKGREAEIYGAKYLSSLGFEILVMNYRSRNGEIDIVALKERSIRFVEVKSSYTSIINPEERINNVKVNKILLASEDFFVDFGSILDVGYDVVVVSREGIFYFPDYLI